MVAKNSNPVVIIQDTREPEDYTFGQLTKIKRVYREKLDFGDYTTYKLKNLIVIERKAKTDLFGTLGKGRERFLRELDRAKEAGVKFFYIVIEASLKSVYQGNNIYRGGKKIPTKVSGSNIVSQLVSFIETHPLNIIPIFADDKLVAQVFIRDVLVKGEDYLSRGLI